MLPVLLLGEPPTWRGGTVPTGDPKVRWGKVLAGVSSNACGVPASESRLCLALWFSEAVHSESVYLTQGTLPWTW
jgi:hypothetical protein